MTPLTPQILAAKITLRFVHVVSAFHFWCPTTTHSLTAALDQLRVVASSTSNDPGPRSGQHQHIGQCLLPLAALLQPALRNVNIFNYRETKTFSWHIKL